MDCTVFHCYYIAYIYLENQANIFLLLIFIFEASCFSSDCRKLALSKMGADYLSNVMISFFSPLFAQDT